MLFCVKYGLWPWGLFYLFLYFTWGNDGWKLVAPFITYESKQLVRLPRARRGWNPHLARLQFSMSKSNRSFFFCHRDGRQRSNNHVLIKHPHLAFLYSCITFNWLIRCIIKNNRVKASWVFLKKINQHAFGSLLQSHICLGFFLNLFFVKPVVHGPHVAHRKNKCGRTAVLFTFKTISLLRCAGFLLLLLSYRQSCTSASLLWKSDKRWHFFTVILNFSSWNMWTEAHELVARA